MRPLLHTQTLYEPLPPGYIRVLNLQGTCLAGSDDDATRDLAIRCKLRLLSLTDIASGTDCFSALSYVWGSQQNLRPIVVNGIQLSCTANLHDALRELAIGKNRTQCALWADAICIDQENDDDKSQQISMMAQIYAQARQVFVWLGTGSGIGGRAFERFWGGATALRDGEARDIGEFDWSAQGAGQQFIAGSHWFQRVWTFQEIVLAKQATVLCGSWAITWQDLEGSYWWMDTLVPHAIETIREARKQPHEGHRQLLEVLELTCSRDSEDPRDRIFALLGLCSPDLSLLLPNYKLSVSQVYAEAASIIIKENGLMNVIRLINFVRWHLGAEINTRRVKTGEDENRSTYYGDVIYPVSWIPNFATVPAISYSAGHLFWPWGSEDCFESSVAVSDICLSALGVVLGIAFEYEGRRGARKLPICISESSSTPSGNTAATADFGHLTTEPCSYELETLTNAIERHESGLCTCACASSDAEDTLELVNFLGFVCVLPGVNKLLVLQPGFDGTVQRLRSVLCAEIYETLYQSPRTLMATHGGCLVKFEITGDTKSWEPLQIQIRDDGVHLYDFTGSMYWSESDSERRE